MTGPLAWVNSEEPPQPPDGLAARYHRGWTVFANWCAAADRQALPTSPLTVAEYLDDYPGSVATQRTRLTAINQAHRAAGWPAPGAAAALREALDDRYARRRARRNEHVERILPQIPVWGWTRGLFGRRNAALLVLAAAGLSYARIAGLTQQDLVLGPDTALIGGQHTVLRASGDPQRCPVLVVRRWAQVLRLAPQPAGRALMEHHLSHRSLPEDELDAGHGNLPLFTSFDARGYTPMHENERLWLQPLSTTSIAAIVAAHLHGRPPMYRTSAATPKVVSRSAVQPTVVEPVVLLDDTYAAGIAARHRDSQRLNDIDELWDDFDAQADRAAQALERALAIANGTAMK